MENETTSFWVDIKKYEDILSKDPSSHCFASLSELYRRIGLLDDAVSVAEKGVALHPEYVAGHLAFGRACFDKGIFKEARSALEQVILFTPENLEAQKLLAQIYIEAGDTLQAEKTLETLLSANPSDAESRIMFESLQRTYAMTQENKSENSAVVESVYISPGYRYVRLSVVDEDDFDVELVEVVYDDELEATSGQTDDIAVTIAEPVQGIEAETPEVIRTATLAELYVKQGHIDQAMQIYGELAANEPGESVYSARLAELRGLAGSSDVVQKALPVTKPISDESVIVSLEEFLENIRRVRACRSERA